MNASRNILEAAQRFDLVNIVAAPANALIFVLPAIAASFGADLATIVVLLLSSRVCAAFAFLYLVRRFLQVKVTPAMFNLELARRMLGYGSWITVSSIVGPLLVYSDRFMVAGVLGPAALSFYATPYELIARAWILPASLVGALFPALTATGASTNAAMEMYARSGRYLLLLVGLIAAAAILFGDVFMGLWLGNEFAERSGPVLRILAVGILVNSLAWLPLVLLQAAGRPDVPARIHLAELGPVLALAWLLIAAFGIVGAALAWSIRVAADSILMFTAAAYVLPTSRHVFALHELRLSILFVILCVAASLIVLALTSAPGTRLAVGIPLLLGFIGVTWSQAMDATERRAVMRAVGMLDRPSPKKTA